MTGPAQPSLTCLKEIVGSAYVLTEPQALAARGIGPLSPAAIVQPADPAQVAEVIRFAGAEKLAVVPCAGGTKLAIGGSPERYDIALDLSRMNHVLAYEPADLTLGVEPGVRVEDLLRVLREQKQLLPLRGAFAARATVGGIAAANSDSPLRHAYGTVRDYCLGMEFVTGEGVASKSGGRVVKNVTGYDLHKLLIGSLGTLAVITRINFRTFPILPEQRSFAVGFAGAAPAFAFCQAIAESPLSAQIAEVADPAAAGLLGIDKSVAGWDRQWWAVLVTVAGEPVVVERHGRDLAALASAGGAVNFHPLDQAAESGVLDAVREFPRLVLESAAGGNGASGAAIFRIGVLTAAMPVLHQGLSETAARNHLGLITLTRASGVMVAALVPTGAETVGSAAAQVFHLCADSKVAAQPALEWAPLEVKRAAGGVWGPPGQDFELMRRIKNIFDPHRVLSPGRLGEGI